MIRNFFLLLSALVLFSSHVEAARLAKIKTREAVVFSEPDAFSEEIGTLSRGTRIKTSNFPKDGFYKVRTPDGELGWVSAESLAFSGKKGKKRRSKREKREIEPEDEESRVSDIYRARAYFGTSLFQLSEVETVTAFTGLSNGTFFAGEFHYPLEPDLSVFLGIGMITKAIRVEDVSTGNVFLFDINSLPVGIGLEKRLSLSDAFHLGLGAMGGIGVGTKMKMTAQSESEPNVTTYSGSPLTFAVRANLQLQLSKTFSLMGEVGYRILKTSEAAPTEVGNGNSIFDSNGATASLPVNLSGIFFGGALEIRW